MSKVFRHGLKEYWIQKAASRQYFSELTGQYRMTQAHRALLKMNQLAIEAKTDRQKKFDAIFYHERYLFAKAMRTWSSFYRSQ